MATFKKVHDLTSYRQHYRASLAAGNAARPAYVERDLSGNCQTPIYRELKFKRRLNYRDGDLLRPSQRNVDWLDGVPDPSWTGTVELWVRCRKCFTCLALRSFLWKRRAMSEIEQSSRTWFGTLTLSSQNHFLMACEAMRDGNISPKDWGDLSRGSAFQLRHKAISGHLTKYLKRVRKESGSPCRYLLVAELHKSGLPHYHILVHEGQAAHPVRHRTLSSQWLLGFSSFKLADKHSAAYCAKYLAKAAEARVRASRRYGEQITIDSLSNR